MTCLRPSTVLGICSLAALAVTAGCSSREPERLGATSAPLLVSPDLVISQMYPGATLLSATTVCKYDFVELFNRGTEPVNLAGKTIQYGQPSSNFTTDRVHALPDFELQPGQYFLVQLAAGHADGTGFDLPTPDHIGSLSLAQASSAKVALVFSDALLSGCGITSNPCSPNDWIDFLGYGDNALQAEGTTSPNTSASMAAFRKGGGCIDTGDNGADFEVATPAPRNSATPLNPCSATVCTENQYVSNHACVDCAPGSTRPAGDPASGADTTCTAIACAANQYVASHACVDCAPGSTRPAGDLATGANTTCESTVCAADEHVANNTCVACAPGSTRPAGDLATGLDTTCADTVCAVNQYVSNHACVDCAPGGTRPAGDLATGANTACENTVCALNERVSNHTCTPCAAGSTRPAGDLASGNDTSCTATVCDANEHVVNHECVPCASGTTRPAGDLATGADTVCTPSQPDAGPGPARDAGPAPARDAGPPPSADAGDSEPPAESDDGGCSVTTSRSNRSTPAASALGVLILAGLRRRRRSHPKPIVSDSQSGGSAV